MVSINNSIKPEFRIRILDVRASSTPFLLEFEETAIVWQDEIDEDTGEKKAAQAMPGKPAIVVQ